MSRTGLSGPGLVQAAALVAAVTVVARVAGLGRWVVFSGSVGSGCTGTAYATVNAVPNVVFEVVAGGALAAVVVPLVAAPLARGQGPDADRTASALLTWAVVALVPIAVAVAVLAGPVARLLLGGAGGPDCPGLADVAARMLVAFAPQLPLYGIGVVLVGVLQAHRRFFAPALAPLASTLVVVVVYLAYGLQTPAGSQPSGVALAWLAWGTTLGVAALSLPLFLPVARSGVRLRPTLRLDAPQARRAAALAGAGLVALLAQQAAVVVALRLANDSGGAGALTSWQYAQVVYLLPYAVLAVPLATASLPQVVQAHAGGDLAGVVARTARATRLVVLGAWLGAGLLIAGAAAVGAFFADVDAATDPSASGGPDVGAALGGLGLAAAVLAPGLVGLGLVAHLGRVLPALGHARSAAASIAAGWAVLVLVALALVPRAGDAGQVVAGLALASTVGMTVAGVALLVLSRARLGAGAVAGVGRALAAGTVAAAASGTAGRFAGDLVAGDLLSGDLLGGGAAAAAAEGMLAALVALVVAAGVLAVLDRPDVRDLRAALPRVGRTGVTR